jgi:hypothetical protein
LRTLKIVNLSYNQLTSFIAAENLSFLQCLWINYNKLTKIVIDENLRKLQKISLNGNLLKAIIIPRCLGALKELHLRDNQLTNIDIQPDWLALQELYLDKNQLTEVIIPQDLLALQVLSVNNNQLTCINIHKNLCALRKLSLSANKLTNLTIPDTLTNLQCLWINTNQLASIVIPGTLQALEVIYLNDNKLVNAFIAKDLRALQVLSLNSNRLINLVIPQGLIALQNLWLNNNPLSVATLVALQAYEIKHVNSEFVIHHYPRVKLLKPLTAKMLFIDFPITFRGFLSNLTVLSQRKYLLNYLKDAINLLLINNSVLNKTTRFPGELLFSVTFMSMKFSSLSKQTKDIDEMLTYFYTIFSSDHNLNLPSEIKMFLESSKNAVRRYELAYVNALNNPCYVRNFTHEIRMFCQGIEGLLKWLRDLKVSKDEAVTRKFASDLKIIITRAGFCEEALIPTDLKVLMPLLVPINKMRPM